MPVARISAIKNRSRAFLARRIINSTCSAVRNSTPGVSPLNFSVRVWMSRNLPPSPALKPCGRNLRYFGCESNSAKSTLTQPCWTPKPRNSVIVPKTASALPSERNRTRAGGFFPRAGNGSLTSQSRNFTRFSKPGADQDSPRSSHHVRY
ncbi:hypothetical protein ACVWXB_008129 [Streptomyces sp. TE12347]